MSAAALPDDEMEQWRDTLSQLPPPAKPSRFHHERFGYSGHLLPLLSRPIPLVALLSQTCLILFGIPPRWNTLGPQLAEVLWLLWGPFWLATLGHVVLRSVSGVIWQRSRRLKHLDWSPRRWHYGTSFILAALPIILVQWSDVALEHYLWLTWYSQQWSIVSASAHAGYNPTWENLWVLIACLPVGWQASRYVQEIPPGRLLGLQRELARLRGEVTWGPEAWGATVGEAVDRWLADLIPGAGAPPAPGASRWQQRQRWARLRREMIAAWVCTPPDLERANRAIQSFRGV
ncbi:MAG: hypothetical protein VKN33_04205 [Candidatus Sericytochromatia bacterium]|nr:hypothetical protein [Candidatus Sericytochromatia bacterium]